MAHTESTESTPAVKSSPASERESPLHESSNISLRALVRFVVIFIVAAVVIHLMIYGVFAAFRAATQQEREITGVTEERPLPPEPRLEPSVAHNALPSQDLERLHAAEREEFARRGWLDEESGDIRVPDSIARQIAEMSRAKR